MEAKASMIREIIVMWEVFSPLTYKERATMRKQLMDLPPQNILNFRDSLLGKTPKLWECCVPASLSEVGVRLMAERAHPECTCAQGGIRDPRGGRCPIHQSPSDLEQEEGA